MTSSEPGTASSVSIPLLPAESRARRPTLACVRNGRTILHLHATHAGKSRLRSLCMHRNSTRAVEMTTSLDTWPVWAATVLLPPGEIKEYKYARGFNVTSAASEFGKLPSVLSWSPSKTSRKKLDESQFESVQHPGFVFDWEEGGNHVMRTGRRRHTVTDGDLHSLPKSIAEFLLSCLFTFPCLVVLHSSAASCFFCSLCGGAGPGQQ